MTDPANQALLKDNNLGKKEIEITSNALSTGYAYSSSLVTSDFGTRMENSVFEEDSSGLEKILSQLPYLSSSDSAECIASIIRRTSNPSIINALLKGVSECPYDPEGKILAALEQKASKIDSKNVTNIESICDAVGGICQFMGKPAYFSKGRNILKNFLSPNQDARSREHVRMVMESLL